VKRFLIIGFALACAGRLLAAEVGMDFSAANKLYAEGKFADAATAYDKIIQTGVRSPVLLFNAGNAEFKSGHLGRAIAAYRQAAQLAPRETELRANLAFVRGRVQGAASQDSFWQNWFGTFTLNEGAGLTAVLFWLTLGTFAVRQLRPALGPPLKTPTRILVTLTGLSIVVLGVQAVDHFNRQTAVVTAAETTARSGPFDEAQSAFTLHDGVELSVLDRHGEWIQVAGSEGRTGWVPVKQVAILPGA